MFSVSPDQTPYLCSMLNAAPYPIHWCAVQCAVCSQLSLLWLTINVHRRLAVRTTCIKHSQHK